MSGKRPVIQCLPVAPVPITRVLYSRALRTHFTACFISAPRGSPARTSRRRAFLPGCVGASATACQRFLVPAFAVRAPLTPQLPTAIPSAGAKNPVTRAGFFLLCAPLVPLVAGHSKNVTTPDSLANQQQQHDHPNERN
jgi:hypothetical protein